MKGYSKMGKTIGACEIKVLYTDIISLLKFALLFFNI